MSFPTPDDRDQEPSMPVRSPAPPREAPAAPRRRVSAATGFWLAAAAFAAQMGFGTAPTPLWPLYQARDGFGPTTVTVAFAIMVVGSAVSFLAIGHLSDRFGRRRAIVPALLVAVLAAVVLTAWPALPGLLLGRLLTGVAVGLMASTATAYLHELYDRAHPGRTSAMPGVVATAANLGGLALGPLIAGVVAEWGPTPLVTAQAVFAVTMTVMAILVLFMPETVDVARRARDRPARFALRTGGEAGFAASAALGFVSFAVFGLISSLGAIMLRDQLGVTSPLVSGIAPFLMFGAAATAQILLGSQPQGRLSLLGLLSFPSGLALVALSLHRPVLWLYLVALVMSGAGAGLLFKVAVGWAAAVAAPHSRAGVLAVFFVISYVGMGLPAILFSLALRSFAPQVTMIGFGAVLSSAAVVALLLTRLSPVGRRR
ncbi:MFS transporter [Streptosporangium sp. NPDC006930]|uniref:MFS transporter n=1 Tax=unclassified Streptosporangium TaxID=2632669 RepID=UPI003428CF25